MKRNIFIKYNPYLVHTEITIDGKSTANTNSKLWIKDGKRLQEWVENLPELLYNDGNVTKFHITFQGTVPDYEDLKYVLDHNAEISDDGKAIPLFFELEHHKAEGVEEKEKKLKAIFEEIKNGPVKELRDPDMLKLFQQQQERSLHVTVVATMSAGKSTLINALLRKKLMPAKQQACTALITEIRDNDKTGSYTGRAFNREGKLIQGYEKLDYDLLKKLNDTEGVSLIRVEGDVPFVPSNEVSLILEDTPGPNNNDTQLHGEITRKRLQSSDNSLILYILTAGGNQTTDENKLLNEVVKSVQAKGKQAKDRFLFVVNQCDVLNSSDDESVKDELIRIKEKLEGLGIKEPNIYPVSALAAFNSYTFLKDIDIAKYEDLPRLEKRKFREQHEGLNEALGMLYDLIDKKSLHLEDYAPLTPSLREKIDQKLAEAKKKQESASTQTISEGLIEESLIHSGIIPLQEAIKRYVTKYERVIQLKRVVDGFQDKLTEQKTMDQLKEKIQSDEKSRNQIREKIAAVQEKLDAGEEAKAFQEKIDNLDISQEDKDKLSSAFFDAQDRITDEADSFEGLQLTQEEAQKKYEKLKEFRTNLLNETKDTAQRIVDNSLRVVASQYIDNYQRHLGALIRELDLKDLENMKINPLNLMKGYLTESTVRDLLQKSEKTGTKQVQVGEWEKNPDYHWYTFWRDEYIYKYHWEEQEYKFIDGSTFFGKFVSPLKLEIRDGQKRAKEHIEEQLGLIKKNFRDEAERLDQILSQKMADLSSCVADKENAEKELKRSQENLKWLAHISEEMNNILSVEGGATNDR